MKRWFSTSVDQDLLLKPLGVALMMASVASLVLCCWPHTTEKIENSWIETSQEHALDYLVMFLVGLNSPGVAAGKG